MSIVLDHETEAKVSQIPDFQDRLQWFINDQWELEQWRSTRAGTGSAGIVREALDKAADLKQSGASRDNMSSRLMELLDRLPGPSRHE